MKSSAEVEQISTPYILMYQGMSLPPVEHQASDAENFRTPFDIS
jgi:hypothetical protein